MNKINKIKITITKMFYKKLFFFNNKKIKYGWTIRKKNFRKKL